MSRSILKIAHRGAKGYEPENTLSAFQKAFDLGCDGIEIDVHLSADGEVIVIHDETVDRTTNGQGRVSELTSSEIALLIINGSESVPTLNRTLDFVNRRGIVNIELKAGSAAQKVAALIDDYLKSGWTPQQFLISSFDWVALKNMHEINPQIPIGVLTETDLPLAIAFAKFINAHSIHPHHHLLTSEMTSDIQSDGFKVYAWTVNEPEDIERLKSFQVDAIISDFPDRI